MSSDSPQVELSENNNSVKNHPVRRLLLFQLKLALDALRDIVLSPVSIVATIIDLIEKKHGQDSHFETLLRMGRESEKRINLFNQHDPLDTTKSVDSVLNQVEEMFLKEYKEGEAREKARKALKKVLKKAKQAETASIDSTSSITDSESTDR